MPRVVHFEIGAEEPARAKRFYEKVFGWKIEKWDGPMEYWLVATGEGAGIDGGIKKKSGTEENTVNTVEVQSVDEISKKIEKSGGKVVMPKMSIPGVGYMAYYKDTESNVFGIMQPDKQAKQ